jgi:Uma2 family endonuclease
MSVTSTPDGGRYTVESYFALARSGTLAPEDHTELLDGVIVAEPPQEPRHASSTTRVQRALQLAVGDKAIIRVQQPFIAGPLSAPEPDVAVVPGRVSDYDERHPSSALLVVEVADSSLPKDRLSKSRIYAGASVVEYWIVNLRDACVEVFRSPDAARRVYAETLVKRRGERLSLAALPGAEIEVNDLLPRAGA